MNQRLKCLLVDDLEPNLLALSAVLRRDDVDILTARSGSEALELLLTNDVALALVDVHMPEMDGFELAELMRGSERTRRIPIIFVTAANREPSRTFKGYHLGAVDFLYKPIDPIVLESKTNVFFDLHRHRLALAEELRQRNETLRLNEMFTAVLGHDLRGPLDAVMTASAIIESRAEEEIVRETAARIRSSGRRMTRMIEDLLDLTRARLSGGIPVHRAPASLATVIDRVVQETQISHPDRAVLRVVDGNVDGEWDADRLQQIVSNLVGNAIRHGVPSEPIIVRVNGSSSDDVVFSVANSGVIPPEVLPSIFDPFYSGRQERSEGLGLGLYIAQQIAVAHHGSIEVDSRPGAPTTFTVRLPRRESQGAAMQPEAQESVQD